MRTATLAAVAAAYAALLASCSGEAKPAASTPPLPTASGAQDPHATHAAEVGQAGSGAASLFARDVSGLVTESRVSSGAVSGLLAQPSKPGTYPSVLMVHEWWGLNDNIETMARLLAAEGYRVLAVDLYGEVATTQEKAKELSGKARADEAGTTAKLAAAADWLRATGSGKLATLGWCFGGQQSLRASLARPADATVIYYGNLVTDSGALAKLNGPVLGIFGDQDQSVPVAEVEKFRQALGQAGKPADIHVYPGVGHAFANPSGARFAPGETLDAWAKTLAFLEKSLR